MSHGVTNIISEKTLYLFQQVIVDFIYTMKTYILINYKWRMTVKAG